jgi:hypothetical protein
LRKALGLFPFRVAISHGSRSEKLLAYIKKYNPMCINHPDSIKLASNKVTCKNILIEKGLPTAKFLTYSEILFGNGRVDFGKVEKTLSFPIVAKLKSGSGGEGMAKLDSLNDLKEWLKQKQTATLHRYFFEEVFQPDLKKCKEYRIAVSPVLFPFNMQYVLEGKKYNFNTGEVISMQKRMKKEAVEKGEFGRNLALGNSYFEKSFNRHIYFKKYGTHLDWEKMVGYCVKAVAACGLDYGAVDILWDSQNDKFCILEINSAPSLGEQEDGKKTITQEAYEQMFKHIIQKKSENKIH